MYNCCILGTFRFEYKIEHWYNFSNLHWVELHMYILLITICHTGHLVCPLYWSAVLPERVRGLGM